MISATESIRGRDGRKSAALVTMAIGNEAQALLRLVHPFMQQYAGKCGCELRVIDRVRLNLTHVKFEKLQLYDLLNEYERIIYIDVDTIIMPHCDDLLKIVPETAFGAYFDSEGGNGDAEIGFPDARGEEIEFIQNSYGHIGWQHTYFNSGVMVASMRHRDIFDYRVPVRKGKRFIDQTHLNYRLQQSGHEWFNIGQPFNHFVGFNRSKRLHDTRFRSQIMHYAGYSEFYEKPGLYEKIEEDASLVLSRKYLSINAIMGQD